VEPTNTVCRAAAEVCDVSESCPGTPGRACPVDGFVSAASVCRGAVDVCDVAETCTGSGAGCPADGFAPATTLCKAGSRDHSDPHELCTGTSAHSPDDVVLPPTTVCNAGSGDSCDPDEKCTGIAGAACPSDTVTAAETPCRASGTGDLTCDPGENCTGVADKACPPDFLTAVGTPCADLTATACTDPDSCDGEGICLANNLACGLLTDSSLCPFDFSSEKGICVDSNGDPTEEACDFLDGDPACSAGSTCEQIGQFRVVFTPDGKIWPGFKLNASNPGQFFYNLFYESTPGGTATLTVTVAYPFVTQGATPVHVYDGASIAAGDLGCFVPQQEALKTSNIQIAIEDYIDATYDGVLMCDPPVCGPDGSGACSFQIEDVPIPPSGIVYANLHLDYGVKGSQLDVNPCDDGLTDRYDRGPLDPIFGGFDALVDTPNPDLPEANDGEGRLAIANFTTYAFSHTDDTTPLFVDVIQNLNMFKRISGVYGITMASDIGAAVPGAGVELVRVSTGELVGSGVTDEDGFYTITYKHKGKREMYDVTLNGDHDITQRIELKANGWAEVNFDVFTGTSTGEFNLDPTPVPEPARWLMLVAGTAFLGLLYRRRARVLRLG
jgi:hypothetical protein